MIWWFLAGVAAGVVLTLAAGAAVIVAEAMGWRR